MPPRMERAPAPLTARERVLVIRLGAVGDVLRALPALHLIRRSYPEAHLAWIVEDRALDLLVDHPDLDQVIRFPRAGLRAAARRPARLPAALIGFGRELRRHGFTVSIDAQGSFKSALIGMLSGARRRVGFAPGHCREASFLLTNEWVRPPSPWLNRVEKNLLLAESLGAAGDEVSVVLPEREAEGREADRLLKGLAPSGEPVIVLSPGTSLRQRYKRWPAEHFARLARLVSGALGVVPLVVWGPGEERLAAAVVEGSAGSARLAPAAGLRPLAAVLRRAAGFVGADTGPMHLAWAVGCPVVALFGPTDPRLNAPLGEGHEVLRGGVTMASIAPETVLDAVGRILARPAAGLRPAPPRLPRPHPGAAGPAVFR